MKEINYEELNSMDLDGVNVVLLFKLRRRMCTLQLKTLDKMEKDNININFYKINIEKNARVSFKYKAFSSPSMLIFKDGKFMETLEGVYDESQLKFNLKD